MKKRYSIIAALALAGSACGGAPKPVDQLVKAEAALRAAREIGAAQIPQAQLHTKLAEEQLTRAGQLIEQGDNAEAERLLLRAKADAEYALALSRKAEAERALNQPEASTPDAADQQSVSMRAQPN
jgi:hypothetical protein